MLVSSTVPTQSLRKLAMNAVVCCFLAITVCWTAAVDLFFFSAVFVPLVWKGGGCVCISGRYRCNASCVGLVNVIPGNLS